MLLTFIDVERIDSVLEEMINNGVQVYFVTDQQYSEIFSSGKSREEFLRGL
jgi:hypothetical protein